MIICKSGHSTLGSFKDRNTSKFAIGSGVDVAFTGLGRDAPRLKGNVGEAMLRVLSRTPDGIVLLETTEAGTLVIWQIHSDYRAFTMHKSYSALGVPIVVSSAGLCR